MDTQDQPRSLPLGFKEFEEFTDRIIAQVGPGFEQVPRDDIRFVLATNITHLGPQDCEKPDSYFVKVLRSAAAKQVAGGVFQQVKEAQRKRQEEEAAAELAAKTTLAEDTATKNAVSDEQTN